MSYDIVKGLKIDVKKGEVWIKCACNNVFPRDFTWHESCLLSKILVESDKKEVEKIVLGEYWGGNFQGSNNLYDKTIKYYKTSLPYTWDNVGTKEQVGTEKYGTVIKYTYDELRKALYQKLIEFKNRDFSKRWAIKRHGSYVKKRTMKYVYSAHDVNTAKKFKSYEDAWLYYPSGEIVEVDK